MITLVMLREHPFVKQFAIIVFIFVGTKLVLLTETTYTVLFQLIK